MTSPLDSGDDKDKAVDIILSGPNNLSTPGTNFMDALRLAHMLKERAILDLEERAKESGANPATVKRIRENALDLARTTPVEKFLLSKTCTKMASYLADAIANYRRDPNYKISKKTAVLKSIISVVDNNSNINRFDAGFPTPVSSAVPVIVFGKRKDLDQVISFILDRSEVLCKSCLHLSMKSHQKKLNKYYRRLKPEEWRDGFRIKDSLAGIVLGASKYRPLELLVVDELNHGFNPEYKPGRKPVGRLGKFHEAAYCFNKVRQRCASDGTCAMMFFATDDLVGGRNQEAMKTFYELGEVIECCSDSGVVVLTDKLGNTVLTLKKEASND